MTCLLELADRVEKAVVGSRELDLEIWRQLKDGKVNIITEYAPFYTTSLDAAVSLVPDGWVCEKLHWWPKSGQPAGCTLLGTHEFRGGLWHKHDDGEVRSIAQTPALALCAAALRARHSAQ